MSPRPKKVPAKKLSVLCSFALVLLLAGCQNSISRLTYAEAGTGWWTESLTSARGQHLGTLRFIVAQNGSALSMSHIDFSGSPQLEKCFAKAPIMTGVLTPGTVAGGAVTINLSYAPLSGGPTNNLTMEGSFAKNMDSGSGNFTLSGELPGCGKDSGSFILSHSGSETM